jgi:CheY-like chemotaxis protein
MFRKQNEPPLLLVADDDADDRLLLRDAFQSLGLALQVDFVENGEELLAALRSRGNSPSRLPHLILLDLNMPLMDGRETLRLIKSDRRFCTIPVVVLTTSQSPRDVAESLVSGANAYIPKPASFDDLAGMLKALCEFWLTWCTLPTNQELLECLSRVRREQPAAAHGTHGMPCQTAENESCARD